MKKAKQHILLFFSLIIVWISLAGIHLQELVVGTVAALVITAVFGRSATIFADINLHPKGIFYFILYLFVFLWELIKANVDVARRVLSPSLPISPGIVKVKTKLKSQMGRTILANSITLTPGTLTVETRDDAYYIHWIDVRSDNIEDATNKIVHTFEKYLEVIFG
jgi:multicomponent Na+:H+ antiporter subunit E